MRTGGTEPQAPADALVQRWLAPFIAALGAVREELGRVKAERDATDRAAQAAHRQRGCHPGRTSATRSAGDG